MTLTCASQKMFDWGKAPINPVAHKYTANHMQFYGKVKKVTVYNNNDTVVYNFSKDGNLTSRNSKNDSKPSEYIYDKKGKLKQRRFYNMQGQTLVFSYTYNSKNQLIKEENEENHFATNYAYNENGLLSSQIDTNGKGIWYEYDKENRLVVSRDKHTTDSYKYTPHTDFLEIEKTFRTDLISSLKNVSYTYYDSHGISIGEDGSYGFKNVKKRESTRDEKENILVERWSKDSRKIIRTFAYIYY